MLSIIIPVYNSEKNIKRCFESIINQTYRSIEVIVVNDGSTDNTADICDEYAEKYCNFKVIHKINGGVSLARNLGIKTAKGEFLQFVDSDDYLEKDMCERLIHTICKDNSDMVICGYKDIKNGNVFYNSCIDKVVVNIQELSIQFSNLYTRRFLNSPWNKLFKKSKINVYYDEELSLGEDLIFNLEYMKNINSISFISDCLYNYINGNDNSLTTKYRSNSMQLIMYTYNYINDFANYCFNGNYEKSGINEVFINDVYGSIWKLMACKTITFEEKMKKINTCILNKEVQYINKNTKLNGLSINIFKFFIRCKMVKMIYIYFFIRQLMVRLKDR